MTVNEINEAAKAEGLTYGQYVIRHEDAVVPRETEPDPWQRICPVCGKMFLKPTEKSLKRYCSDRCRTNAQVERAKAKRHEAVAEGKEETMETKITLGTILDLLNRDETEVSVIEECGDTLVGKAKCGLWEPLKNIPVVRIGVEMGFLLVETKDVEA